MITSQEGKRGSTSFPILQRMGNKMVGCNHSNGGKRVQCHTNPTRIPDKCPTNETRGKTTCKTIESIPKASTYHAPPPGVDYSTNPSVFGQILSGKLPARTISETTNLLAFEDRSPAAELHGLVIPKRYIESVFSLDPQSRTDIELVQEMHQMGLSLIEEYHPEALASGDYTLCFHIPPFTSVDHLHLHVLAPASSMSWWYGSVKYKCPKRWCVSDMTVLERLQEGKPAVPYNKPFKIFPTR